MLSLQTCFIHLFVSAICKLKLSIHFHGLPWWLSEESTCQSRRCGFEPWVREIPWRRKWQHTPVFLSVDSQDRGSWWEPVHGVTKSQTWLSNWTITTSFSNQWVYISWQIWRVFSHHCKYFLLSPYFSSIDKAFLLSNSSSFLPYIIYTPDSNHWKLFNAYLLYCICLSKV